MIVVKEVEIYESGWYREGPRVYWVVFNGHAKFMRANYSTVVLPR